MRLWAILSLALLTACGVPEPRSAPLLYDQTNWDDTTEVVIAIPGAFTSIQVMTRAKDIAGPDRALAYYRLPGLDGRPEDDFINLDFAAHYIARAVMAKGFERVHFIGHSTGGVIALEAAKVIKAEAPETQVQVATISTALPAPQTTFAGVRGAGGTIAAATRIGSLNPRKVWREYYRVLAFGSPENAEIQIAERPFVLSQRANQIILPTPKMLPRHTRDLRRWTNPDVSGLEDVPITLFHGSVDPVFPARAVARFAGSLPQAKLYLIEDHGHLLMLTFPEVWDMIQDQFDASGKAADTAGRD